MAVAIVGSGPSGFFCADDLLRLTQPCQVHMFDRRPYPFGLVRDAVAPDHENIRGVTRAFDRIARHEGFFFHGNMEIGSRPAVADLLSVFDAVIVATGAETPRELSIPGADYAGCMAAAHFAEWYNGSPPYRDLRPHLDGDTAVVIGGGNVALDMARMLAQTHERLQHTDISSAALRTLRDSRIREIHVVVRAAMTAARFSPVELELLREVPECSYTISETLEKSPDGAATTPASEMAQKNCKILQTMAAIRLDPGGCRRRIHFHFGKCPVIICGGKHLEGIVLETVAGSNFHSSEPPAPRREYIPCRMVLYAIGQQGNALPGLPFDDQKGVIPHSAGRIQGFPRVYVAGWIKRGAQGVIGINRPDCRETVRSLMEDRSGWGLTRNADGAKSAAAWCAEWRRPLVSYEDWTLLDAEEQRRGRLLGKSRERFGACDDMLAFLCRSAGYGAS